MAWTILVFLLGVFVGAVGVIGVSCVYVGGQSERKAERLGMYPGQNDAP